MFKYSSGSPTLIELSAAIVNIEILIAGVMTANGLVKKSKITIAAGSGVITLIQYTN